MLCYSHHMLQEDLYKEAPPSFYFDPMFPWALFLPSSCHARCHEIILTVLDHQRGLHLRIFHFVVPNRPP